VKQRYKLWSALRVIREFNALVRPGDVVELEGRQVKTWSPAGLGRDGDAVVFVEDTERPVSLCKLTVLEKT
jgi:hypothetical protein